MPPAVRRFWSPIATLLLQKSAHRPHSKLGAVGGPVVRRLPAGVDDAADLGRARTATGPTGDDDRRVLAQPAARSGRPMIYLDSSVALAHRLAEDRFLPDALWDQQLVSSRLLECGVWNRINAHQLQDSHGAAVPSPCLGSRRSSTRTAVAPVYDFGSRESKSPANSLCCCMPGRDVVASWSSCGISLHLLLTCSPCSQRGNRAIIRACG